MSACSRCGALFSCGMADAANGRPCWCAALPRLPLDAIGPDRTTEAASCLCPDCLNARIAEQGGGLQPNSKDP